jgi:hypothetical protein
MQKVAAGVPLLLRRRRGLKLRGRRARGGLDSRTSSRGGPKGGDGDADPPTRQLEMGTAARRRSRPATSSFPAGSGLRARPPFGRLLPLPRWAREPTTAAGCA